LPENAKPVDTPLQLGLFSYPVLQAADVLVHRATHVPVGEDQSQHLEFARNCAASFNHIYGNVLVEPETMLCTYTNTFLLLIADVSSACKANHVSYSAYGKEDVQV
jgi:tryptophanyl-tRNA synthetase